MNYKKGFIWMVILMVIVIIVAVVGVTYYMGKSSNTLPSNIVENNLPQENQVINNIEKDCMPTTTPWIKVLSPNGRETYAVGQKIIVNWESCNISKEAQVFAQLAQGEGQGEYREGPGGIEGVPYYSSNNGSEDINLLLKMFGPNDFSYGKNFRIQVTLTSNNNIFDYSDNYFTINSQQNSLHKEGETCGEGIGSCETGLECFYPCGIPGCQYKCAPKGTLPRP